MSHKLAKQIRKNHGNEFRTALKNESGKFKSKFLLGRGLVQVWAPSKVRCHYLSLKRMIKNANDFNEWRS